MPIALSRSLSRLSPSRRRPRQARRRRQWPARVAQLTIGGTGDASRHVRSPSVRARSRDGSSGAPAGRRLTSSRVCQCARSCVRRAQIHSPVQCVMSGKKKKRRCCCCLRFFRKKISLFPKQNGIFRIHLAKSGMCPLVPVALSRIHDMSSCP